MEEVSKRDEILNDVQAMLAKLDSIIRSDFYLKTDFDNEGELIEVQTRLRGWFIEEEDKRDHGYK